MNEKIVDLITANRDADGQTLPIEKEMFIKSLLEIPHDIAQEYADILGTCIDEQIVLKNIISSSNRPYLVKHLIDDLSEALLGRLCNLINQLKNHEREKMITEIVNATFGLSMVNPEKEKKAAELVSIVTSLDIDYENEAKSLAEISNYTGKLSSLMNVCKSEERHDYIFWRLSVLPENELDWMLTIARNRLKNEMAN